MKVVKEVKFDFALEGGELKCVISCPEGILTDRLGKVAKFVVSMLISFRAAVYAFKVVYSAFKTFFGKKGD